MMVGIVPVVRANVWVEGLYSSALSRMLPLLSSRPAIETAGFGMGIEQMVAWLTGIHHIRECIPFPRMMERLEP